jgi:hypothetical protein
MRGFQSNLFHIFRSCILFDINVRNIWMDKYKYENSLVLFFAGHFFTWTVATPWPSAWCCAAPWLRKRGWEGASPARHGWWRWLGELGSHGWHDVTQWPPNTGDGYPARWTTGAGRRQLGQGAISVAALLHGGAALRRFWVKAELTESWSHRLIATLLANAPELYFGQEVTNGDLHCLHYDQVNMHNLSPKSTKLWNFEER